MGATADLFNSFRQLGGEAPKFIRGMASKGQRQARVHSGKDVPVSAPNSKKEVRKNQGAFVAWVLRAKF